MLEKVGEAAMDMDLDKLIDDFEEMTKNAAQVQREVLEKILTKNGSAEYLLNFGLNRSTDPEMFKSCVPVVTDKDMEPYIQRIVDGDTSPILTSQPVPAVSLSSGTSQGKPKFVPFTDELVDDTLQIFRTAYAFRCREFPIGRGKVLQFVYSSKQFETKGGLPAGTATTNLYRNPSFKDAMKSFLCQSSSPEEVIFGLDFHQALYCHLLCGLIFREEIQLVFSTFAHSLVHSLRTFERVWEELVTDIREGVLSSRVTSPSARAAMSKILKPDPELADLIYEKCTGLSNWYGLIPALFPNAKYVYGIMTGSMEPYLNKLRHYTADLPLVSHDYGSSEGWIAVNVNPRLPPEEATFAVLPNIGYFEFLPLNPTSEETKPLGLTEVIVGEEYEIIFTNFAGLYRYSLGDVVKVMGFYNNTPELKFICRKNLMLTINIDKNTEKDLQLSVFAAAKILCEEKLEMIDFTSFVDFSSDPGHYVIFWEISGEAKDDVLQECCNCLDRSFVDAGYVTSRKINSIGPLELRVLTKGTFQKILEHSLALGAAVSQFKTPRCVKPNNKMVLQILCDNVGRKYFSTAY